LGTTRSIYASTVVGTVIPLTHWLPSLLDKIEEPEQHLIKISLSRYADTR